MGVARDWAKKDILLFASEFDGKNSIDLNVESSCATKNVGDFRVLVSPIKESTCWNKSLCKCSMERRCSLYIDITMAFQTCDISIFALNFTSISEVARILEYILFGNREYTFFHGVRIEVPRENDSTMEKIQLQIMYQR